MSQEIVYTSAPQGLKMGSRGFCTVASTSGMASSLAERLESLSGYRHLYPPQDPQARLNPTAWSHLMLTVGGKRYHVLSRIADAGLDYSQRSNKLAHHVALDASELAPAGPAWCLLQPDFMFTSWNEAPRLLTSGRTPPPGELRAGVCQTWREMTGDAGWGGVLAQAADGPRDAYLIFAPGMDVLPLLVEAQALLPPAKRWEVSFSTFVTKLPPGVECRWRCVVAGSEEALLAQRLPGATVIDLTTSLGPAPEGPLVTAARTGVLPASASPPPVPKTSAAAALTAAPLAGLDTTPDADLLADVPYRLAADPTLGGPPPTSPLKLLTRPSGVRTKRLAPLLALGGLAVLLLLLGGGYWALLASGYLDHTMVETVDTGSEQEAKNAIESADKVLAKWNTLKRELDKEEALSLGEHIAQLEQRLDAGKEHLKSLDKKSFEHELAGLKAALHTWNEAVARASKPTQKLEEATESQKRLDDAHMAVQANIKDVTNKVKQAQDEAQKKARAASAHAESKVKSLEQLFALAEDLRHQRDAIVGFDVADTSTPVTRPTISKETQERLKNVKKNLEVALNALQQDNLADSWDEKKPSFSDDITVLSQADINAPDVTKEVTNAEQAVQQFEELNGQLTDAIAKLKSLPPVDLWSKLEESYVIDNSFPIRNGSGSGLAGGTTANTDRILLELPLERQNKLQLEFVGNSKTLSIKGDSSPWIVEQGKKTPLADAKTIGRFVMQDGRLKWFWEGSVHHEMHNVKLKLSVGESSREITLFTKTPQTGADPITLTKAQDIWRTTQPTFRCESAQGLKLHVLDVEFAGPLTGFAWSARESVLDTSQSEIEVVVRLAESKAAAESDWPRFTLVLCFKRQPESAEWILKANSIRVLIREVDGSLSLTNVVDGNMQVVSQKTLFKRLLDKDSSKFKVLDKIRNIDKRIEDDNKKLEAAKKTKDEKERNKKVKELTGAIDGLNQDRKMFIEKSNSVFPDDLYKKVETDRVPFVDELCGSIKVHLKVVRQEDGQPEELIAQFGSLNVGAPQAADAPPPK